MGRPRQALPEGPVCSKCNEQHIPTHCQKHSKSRGGRQCGNPPMDGQDACRDHGGKTPAALAKAADTLANDKARKALGKLHFTPVDNPLEELRQVAGRAKAFMEMVDEHMATVTSLRYSTDGGEQIRGEIVLAERAMERAANILIAIAKLNLDERLVRVSERQVQTFVDALKAGFALAQISGDQQQQVLVAVASALRPQPVLNGSRN